MRKLLLITLSVLAYTITYAQNITTIAGGLGDGGPATNTPLNFAASTVVDDSGNIYIADVNNHRIRKVTVSTGIISTVAGNGTQGYGGDGSAATSANLNYPRGVAVDGSGNIYIADKDNNRIRKVTISTGTISTIAGNGTYGYSGDGYAATSANLADPQGVAVDVSGNIYIVDYENFRIRKVTVSTGIISTVAGNGNYGYTGNGGSAILARLAYPSGVAVDNSGNIYIADKSNQRIRKVTASTGIINTIVGNGTAGFGGDGNAATLANLADPQGVAVDVSGNIYITDAGNLRIRKVTASTGIISTVAGNGSTTYGGDGSKAKSSILNNPNGVTVDGLGNIYIADFANHRIRKITASTGIISTVAGNGINGYGGDSSAATSANLYSPIGLAVDGSRNIYIADYNNHRIRKVSTSTGIISTVAGNGISTYGGDGNAATLANLSRPSGVAVDSSGNIYIADTYNYRIRKVSASTGIITTVAGNGTSGYSGDGSAATSAKLDNPTGLAVDGSGNIYIADAYNQRIRKVTASTGIISTVAGNGYQGNAGDGSAATSANLYSPSGVAVDDSGNIYIADVRNHSIRKVTASTGIISKIAGNGTQGFGGDDSAATLAKLNSPGGIAVDGLGNIYIADVGNRRIRKVIISIDNNIIANSQTICAGSAPAILTGSTPIGATGSYSYTWLRSTTNSTSGFTAIPSTNTINYSPSAITQNTWFRRYVVSGAFKDTSAAVAITVNSAIANNTITGTSQTICSGSIPAPITATTATGGNGSNYTYKWLKSTTSATTGFTNAGNNDSTQNFTANALTQNTWFKRIVSSGVCNADTTAALLLTVIPVIASNTITSATQTICSGSIPDTIKASIASGGNNTTYIYKWLKSTTSATTGFVNAGDLDSLQNFTSNALTQKTWFKRKVTSGNCTDTTVALLVTVNNAIATNTITGTAQIICSGSIPAPITATTATGGNGTTYNYKWLKSTTSAAADFTNAGSNDSIQNFTPNAITQNTWFKRRVSSGACNADTTAALMVTVNAPITNNTITATVPTICSGSIPSPITATIATGGNGTTYNYKWLKSTTNATTGFANAGGNDSIQNFTSNAITQNTWFKRRVSSGACNADTTAALLVTINTAIANNTISSTTQTICSGSIPAPITATIATGGNGTTYKYKWLKSITNATIGFTNAGGNDSTQNFISNALTQNTWLKRVVSSGVCNVDTTAAFLVTVNPKPSTSNITGLTNVARLDTASYSVNGTSGSVFNWVTAKGLVQTGVGTNQIQVKWNIAGIDSIKVIETSNQGCVGTQKTLLVNIGPATGMNEINTSNSILVYPNPFNETIYVSLLNNSDFNKAILYDLLGKEILTTHKSEIDVKELKSGVYLMMVIDNNGNSYNQKLIKN